MDSKFLDVYVANVFSCILVLCVFFYLLCNVYVCISDFRLRVLFNARAHVAFIIKRSTSGEVKSTLL